MTQTPKHRDKDKTGLLVYQTCYPSHFPKKYVELKEPLKHGKVAMLFKYYVL